MGKQKYVKASSTIISRVAVSEDANSAGVTAFMVNRKSRLCEKKKKSECKSDLTSVEVL